MAITKDKEGRDELARIVGPRLKAARRAAGVEMAEAASHLGHREITQVSLAESGQRLPPALDLLKYAKLYGVPTDYLYGLIDDPLAEACELGHGARVRMVGGAIAGLFQKFAGAVASHTAVSLSTVREEWADLNVVIEAGSQASHALARIRQLNPEFDELRGGAPLQAALDRIEAVSKRVEARTARRREEMARIDRALHLEEPVAHCEQFALQFRVPETEA